MNVRLDFPVLICFASAWTISGECRKRWKLVSTRIAELSGEAMALIDADGGQRIAAGVGGCVLARNLQAGGDVPDGKPPVLVAAELGNLGQGIIVFVRAESRGR